MARLAPVDYRGRPLPARRRAPTSTRPSPPSPPSGPDARSDSRAAPPTARSPCQTPEAVPRRSKHASSRCRHRQMPREDQSTASSLIAPLHVRYGRGASSKARSRLKFRTPDIAPCWNVRSRRGCWEGCGGDRGGWVMAGRRRPIRGGGCTAKRILRREPGKMVSVWSRMSHKAWAAWVRCGELRGARVMDSSRSETAMSPAAAKSSCRRVRPSCSARR